ncbi:hypothetical protein D0Z08_26115 [Nocardioides immobilis]|uniref:DUF3352 domain-containing protein n=2 Tax=Nocardioides immobilis TaxID=2049295 RepID=A0A417XV71_9ACTN|nr:hypothetical protein D0Z08_26115 [Nocardioides immobilis]
MRFSVTAGEHASPVHRASLALLATCLLAPSALVAGCSDDADPADSREHYSVLDAIGELPASIEGDAPLIFTGDLTRASEIAGLNRPTDADSDEVNAWVADLTAAPDPDETARVFVPLPGALIPWESPPADMDAQVGWSVVDVESFVALTQPPEHFLVVSGDFDDDTLDEDLSEVEGGVVTDVEGADLEQNLLEPTAFSRVGAPTRLAEDDGRIAASSTTDAVRDWLDGDVSLADDEGYADVATALDEHEVYAAVLSGVQTGIDPAGLILGSQGSAEELQALREQLEDELPEASYDTVGIAWSADDQAPLVATAYHFSSEADAENSADPLRELYESGTSVESQRPFSDYLTVENVEVQGSVVVVTSRPAEDVAINFAYQALLQRDLLFISR